MSPVVDRHVSKRTLLAKHVVTLKPRDITTGDTTPAKLIAEFKPGVPFEIESVQYFGGAVVAGADVDVLIGATSVLAAAISDPTAATRQDVTLSTTRADRKGTATDLIKVTGLSDGSGTLADIQIILTLISPTAAY